MFKKQRLIGYLGALVDFILAWFLLYFFEAGQLKLAGIALFLLSFSYALFFPWIYWSHLFWPDSWFTFMSKYSRNPNRSSYSDKVFQRRFRPFTTSKKGRMIGMWIGCIVAAIFIITNLSFLEVNKETDKFAINGLIIFFVGGFFGWGLGLLRDFYAFKKLPKGTIYQDN